MIEQQGEGIVQLIESGKLYSEEMTNLLSYYIKPLIKAEVDCLVLGCTHYPYLIPQIRKIVGNKIQIIDSGEAVARQTKAVLHKNNLINTSKDKSEHKFYINKDKKILELIMQGCKTNIEIEEKDF